MKLATFLTAVTLLAVLAVAVTAGFVYTIVHATVRMLELIGATP